ncbi:MAG: ABC transporter permease, partial [Lachnospiraceae bacterium]|nr:ABC transporter permease [Lachnospiraceae bacterium]
MNFKPISVLTKRTFRQNKGRNLVAALAIILTTLMFTTLFVLSQSMNKNLIEMAFRQTGYDAQVSFKSITEEQAGKLAAHPDVAEVGNSVVVGMGQGKALGGRQVEVRYGDEIYARHSFAIPSTGRMPVSAEEIALDTIILDRLRVPHELGQSITLEWTGDLAEAENQKAEFTLCGFWEGNESVYASMAWVSRDFADDVISKMDQSETDDASSRITGIHMAQVSLYDDSNIEAAMDRILEDTGLSGLTYGVNLAYDPDINRMAAQETLPMYLGMILVFVSGYLIIYNIFQISVTADIQFYGKLKTLGTTAKQLRKLIYGQAARLCLMGIPVGMLSGYLLGVVLVPVLIRIPDASSSASPLIFMGSALFSAVTVLISCMRPAKIAGKVSPMEALRYNDVQRGGRGSKKRSGNASLSALAWSNLGRNRKRTVTVICSLTLGLTLMSAFYARNAAYDMEKYLADLLLGDYQINEATSEEYIKGYDPCGDTLSPQLIAQVEGLPGLEGMGFVYSHETQIDVNEQTIANLKEYYTEDILADWRAYDSKGPESLQEVINRGRSAVTVYGLNGIALEAYCKEDHLLSGSYDAEQFATGKYVLAAGISVGKEEGKVLPAPSVGDTVQIEGADYTVMAVLDNLNVITEGAQEGEADRRYYLEFILPSETFKANWPENTPRKLFFNIDDEHLDAAQEMLDQYQAETGRTLPITTRQSMAQQYEREVRSSALMGNVISIVIALVGVLNFVNSMVTSIVSRKKEFAMMQSVGMTKKQLCRLLIYEGMDYAWITLLITYAASSFIVGVGVRA